MVGHHNRASDAVHETLKILKYYGIVQSIKMQN